MLVKVGQEVKQGDILVSGIIEKADETLFLASKGQILVKQTKELEYKEKYTQEKEIEKKETEEKQRKNIIAKRKEILKEQDFSNIKCRLWRFIRTFFNTWRVYINIMRLSKENIKYFSAVDSLINIANALLFRIFRIVLYLVALFAVTLIFFKMNIVVCVVVAFASFTIAQLIRIAENEVENMTERDYAVAIFSGLISVMSLIVSIISMIITSQQGK